MTDDEVEQTLAPQRRKSTKFAQQKAQKKSKGVSFAATPAKLKRSRANSSAIPDNLDAAAAAGNAIEFSGYRRGGSRQKAPKTRKLMRSEAKNETELEKSTSSDETMPEIQN